MAEEEEPKDAVLGEIGWGSLDPHMGEVLEVFMPSTEWEDPPQEWVGFLIMQVSMDVGTGALVLEVKSLGSGNAELAKQLGRTFNRRRGLIHLCTSKPCTTSNNYDLHATRVRVIKLANFEASYVTRSMRSQIKKWLGSSEDVEGEKPEPSSAPRRRLRGKSGEREAGLSAVPFKANPKRKSAVRKIEDRGGGKKPKSGDPPAASVDALKVKLASLKARLTGSERSTHKDTEGDQEDGVLEVESSEEEEYEPSLAPLETGTEIVPVGVTPSQPRKKVKKSRGSKVATKGTTIRGLQGQLATRAVAVSERRKDRKREKKSAAEKVGEAIVKALHGGKVKKEKKSRRSKKERKRRKRQSMGDGPSSSGDSGSSGESSDESSSEKSQGSSEEYENPTRKKSKERPGAVLELLVQHAREQLEQSSTVSLRQGKVRVDEGVRILSYFQILLRPQLGAVTGPIREMFLIASVLDQLRSGNLSAVGDGLAARFFALHQSILDGGWAAARHLEIFALEETSATTTAMLLQTRRHAKLAAKAMGAEVGYAPNWWRGGRGRGGKGSKGQKGGDGDAKGPKGKGKEKGKGRGTWQNPGKGWGGNDGGAKGAQEWAAVKETGKDA